MNLDTNKTFIPKKERLSKHMQTLCTCHLVASNGVLSCDLQVGCSSLWYLWKLGRTQISLLPINSKIAKRGYTVCVLYYLRHPGCGMSPSKAQKSQSNFSQYASFNTFLICFSRGDCSWAVLSENSAFNACHTLSLAGVKCCAMSHFYDIHDFSFVHFLLIKDIYITWTARIPYTDFPFMCLINSLLHVTVIVTLPEQQYPVLCSLHVVG